MANRQEHHLKQLLDSVLISGLPQGLKDAIDSALSKGGDAEVIRKLIEKGTATAPMTRAAAEAYLEQRVKERQEGQ
jgi:hypothetical protein